MNSTNRQISEPTNSSNSGGLGGDNEIERVSMPSKLDLNGFIGKDELLEQFRKQLKQFEEWNVRKDWLAFHHHHYDWWMFPSELKIKFIKIYINFS
jgi:hypothetical protein